MKQTMDEARCIDNKKTSEKPIKIFALDKTMEDPMCHKEMSDNPTINDSALAFK